MLDDPELLDEFVDEARDHLARIETILSGTSRGSSDFVESISAVFRGMHSIKGAAALLGLPNICELSNAVESVLAAARAQEYELEAAGIETLLRARDRLLEMVDDLANEGLVDARAELAALHRLLAGGAFDMPQGRLVSQPRVRGETLAESQVAGRADPGAESVRVPLVVLDRVMAAVGELVLVRNRTRQNFEEKKRRNPALATGADRRLLQQLDHVTCEIQQSVLRTRMQAIHKVFAKIPKVCRDLEGKLEKRIQPVSIGAEVEVDKAILECLSSPLLHLIRNACDHGLERPEERAAAGKPLVGTLTVEARLDSGQLSISISDDGRGIDTKRVAEKAVAQGIRTLDEVEAMSEQQLCFVVFEPGLSTVEALSDVSGRGVGLDVVRTSIEGIGGSVDVHSRRGEGTSFTLQVPLSLAIVPSLLVDNAGEIFAIPQVNLEEVLRLRCGEGDARVEYVCGRPAVRCQGELIPLVRLGDALHGRDDVTCRASTADVDLLGDEPVVTVVIVRVAQLRFGIIVDAAIGSEAVVVKPNRSGLDEERCSVGSTSLSDGRVAVILDVNGVCEYAMVLNGLLDTGSANDNELVEKQSG